MQWLGPAHHATIGDRTPPARPLVELRDGRALASSIALAQRLGRPHHVVICDITQLGCSEYFTARNFITTPCGESVWLTREGIGTLLGACAPLVGWEGAGVDQLRADYAAAFDLVEARGRQQCA